MNTLPHPPIDLSARMPRATDILTHPYSEQFLQVCQRLTAEIYEAMEADDFEKVLRWIRMYESMIEPAIAYAYFDHPEIPEVMGIEFAHALARLSITVENAGRSDSKLEV